MLNNIGYGDREWRKTKRSTGALVVGRGTKIAVKITESHPKSESGENTVCEYLLWIKLESGSSLNIQALQKI